MEELEIKKLKTTNTILIVITVLLMLGVGALSYYSFFMKEDVKNETNKEENKDNILTQDQMMKILSGFPYEKILSIKDRNSNSLTDEELLYIGASGLYDANKSYKGIDECSGDNGYDDAAKCFMKALGLSDEEIKLANTKLWENSYGGSTAYEVYTKNQMVEKIILKTGQTFDFKESFVENIDIICGGMTVIYDKNVDMIFTKLDGGCLGLPSYITITDGVKDGENYVISMVKGMLELYDLEDVSYYKLFSEANPNVIIKDNISGNLTGENLKDLILQYKDSLDRYDLTFKKVGDNYQFVSVDYIE